MDSSWVFVFLTPAPQIITGFFAFSINETIFSKSFLLIFLFSVLISFLNESNA